MFSESGFFDANLAFAIDGTLMLNVANNFDAKIGDSYQIINSPAVSGQFNSVDQSSNMSATHGYLFDVVYGGNFVSVEVVSRYLLGDANMDGVVDLLDVAAFVQVLVSGSYLLEADVNGDGVVDLLDVAPFAGLLTD